MAHTPAQIRNKASWVKKLMAHHFGKTVKKIEFKPAGRTNFVFEVHSNKEAFIVRIAGTARKMGDFIKEQWVTQKASEKGVPVPEILEVGNSIIPHPYMVQRMIRGKEAMDHPNRLEILRELGAYAKRIHSIPTSGFGTVFDWSHNRLSKQATWTDYLENELNVTERLKFMQHHDFLTRKKTARLLGLFEKIKKWKIDPVLNHCDLRLKNVIVNNAGKIVAILDWENCSSNIAPYWDLSIALHDLSIDGKHNFLEGYGLDYKEFSKMSYALTAFNLVNYIPALQQLIAGKKSSKLELYKLRLDGALDLFSL